MKSTKELAKELGLVKKRRVVNNFQRTPQNLGQRYSFLLIMDFESTCWDNDKYRTQEIIEFPAVLMNTSTGEIESEFQYYIQPQEQPTLSAFCKELTGISQEQVDEGIPLSLCIKKFNHWLEKLERENNIMFINADFVPAGVKAATVVTWSDWDLSVCLLYETRRKQIRTPYQLNSWIDLRQAYRKFYKRKPNGLNGALQDVGIQFEGREHSGLHDSRNTACLSWRMIRDGCVMNITKSLDRKSTVLLNQGQSTLSQFKKNHSRQKEKYKDNPEKKQKPVVKKQEKTATKSKLEGSESKGLSERDINIMNFPTKTCAFKPISKNIYHTHSENHLNQDQNRGQTFISFTVNRYSVTTQGINRDRTVKPESVNRDQTVKPESVNRDQTVKPESVNRDQTVKPESVNINQTVKPESVNRDQTVKLESVNRDQIVKPESVNRDQIVKPESVNRGQIVKPESVNRGQTVSLQSVNCGQTVNTQNAHKYVNRDQCVNISQIVTPQNVHGSPSVKSGQTVTPKTLIQDQTITRGQKVPPKAVSTVSRGQTVTPPTENRGQTIKPSTKNRGQTTFPTIIRGQTTLPTVNRGKSITPQTVDLISPSRPVIIPNHVKTLNSNTEQMCIQDTNKLCKSYKPNTRYTPYTVKTPDIDNKVASKYNQSLHEPLKSDLYYNSKQKYNNENQLILPECKMTKINLKSENMNDKNLLFNPKCNSKSVLKEMFKKNNENNSKPNNDLNFLNSYKMMPPSINSSTNSAVSKYKNYQTSLLCYGNSRQRTRSNPEMKATPPLCNCGKRSKRRMVQNPGPNIGRFFFSCSLGSQYSKLGCGFFQWEMKNESRSKRSHSFNSSTYK